MKSIKVLQNFKYQGSYYYENTILKPTLENFGMIKILNEKGFIEPLTPTELEEIKKI